MLTILHDRDHEAGIETAECNGIETQAPRSATCALARRLVELGYDATEEVRLVRADPILSGPPYEVRGLTLALAQHVDPFQAQDGRVGVSLPAPRRSTSA